MSKKSKKMKFGFPGMKVTVDMDALLKPLPDAFDVACALDPDRPMPSDPKDQQTPPADPKKADRGMFDGTDDFGTEWPENPNTPNTCLLYTSDAADE